MYFGSGRKVRKRSERKIIPTSIAYSLSVVPEIQWKYYRLYASLLLFLQVQREKMKLNVFQHDFSEFLLSLFSAVERCGHVLPRSRGCAASAISSWPPSLQLSGRANAVPRMKHSVRHYCFLSIKPLVLSQWLCGLSYFSNFDQFFLLDKLISK